MSEQERESIARRLVKPESNATGITGFAAAAIALLSIGATFAWLRLDRAPPSWDDGYYLTKSLELYDTLTDKGAVKYAARFLTIMDRKPPLIAALPTPIYLIAGRKYRAAYGINLLFLAIMFAAMYGIARRFAGARAGLIAVATVASIPVIFGLSHWYLVECGLVALVCVAIYLMIGWTESSGAGRAALLGITFALGMLMKASFLVYVIVPFAYFAYRWRKTVSWRMHVLPFVAAFAVLAGPWYVLNARGMLATAIRAGSAETAKTYDTGAAFSVEAMGHYLFNVAHSTPWLYLAALPVLVAIGWPKVRESRQGVALAMLWLSPIVLLTVGHYRDIRYAAPLYPAVALLVAWMADAAIRNRGAIAFLGIGMVLVLGWASMLQNSFDSSDKRLQLGGFLLEVRRLYYARAYDGESWPQQELLADIYRASNGGETRSVLIGTNSIRFNADNFTLAAVQGRLPFEIATTAYINRARDVQKALDRADYFIYEEGGELDQPNFNELKDAAINQAREGGRFVDLPLSRALPDGGVAHVLANIRHREGAERESAPVSSELGDIPACSVNFGGKVELAGIGVKRIERGIEVKYRWRCIQPMDRDYLCFTHVVDREGKVIGYLDHRFLNGDPPTSRWRAGDVVVERLVFPIREGDAAAYEFRVGVYHRASGERLPIGASTFRVIQEHTAAVIGAR